MPVLVIDTTYEEDNFPFVVLDEEYEWSISPEHGNLVRGAEWI